MKKSLKILTTAAMLLLFGACNGGEKTQVLDTNKVYKIGTTAEYPPFESLSNGKIVGYDVDVIVPTGYPKVKKLIEDAGYKVLCTDTSEFRKIDGGLSCLSLRF